MAHRKKPQKILDARKNASENNRNAQDKASETIIIGVQETAPEILDAQEKASENIVCTRKRLRKY